jgi:tetratricopeptide (TPR) repeat protein
VDLKSCTLAAFKPCEESVMTDPTRTRFRPFSALLLAAGLASLPAVPAWAADTPEPAPRAAPADRLAPARALIAQAKWREAIAALQRVNDSGNADWNNLMGYSHRKASNPDLAAAERFYDAALRIQPSHRGALEYSGELYLMKADLPRAEARLAELEKACPGGCEELNDLKAAVAKYKADGGRPSARP